MKRVAIISILCLNYILVYASETHVARVKDNLPVGIYITSIHDINFKDQEYEIDFWLWLNKSDFKNLASFTDLLNSIEIPEAKSKEFQYTDSTTLPNIVSTKVHCRMKDSWNIKNFPFDHQTLQLTIESSIFPSHKMAISLNNNSNFLYNKTQSNNIIQGWNIEGITADTGVSKYFTNFGDTSVKFNKSIGSHIVEYSKAQFTIEIHREYWGIFLKVFLCMYISFLIAYASFFVHFESIDSRLSLSVGALFAVIGNKYITEAALPESVSFTLVDILHATTMFFVLLIITMNTFVLKLVNNEKHNNAQRIDKLALKLILLLYILINIYFVYNALNHE